MFIGSQFVKKSVKLRTEAHALVHLLHLGGNTKLKKKIEQSISLCSFKTYLSDLISIKSNSLYNIRSTGKPLYWIVISKPLLELRQATSLDSFKCRLKTYLFKKYFYNL